MESKRSFKEKVEKANTWLTSIVFAVVILFCIISYWTASSYNRIFQGYRELQSYYDNVKVSSDELKKYLTSQDEENLKLHETSIHAAKHSLENILDNPVMEEKWRFRLLKNMLNEYENSIKELMEQYIRNDDLASYRDYYERFSMNEKLIQEIEVDGRKRTYRLTEKGHTVFQEELDRLRSCVADGEEESQ